MVTHSQTNQFLFDCWWAGVNSVKGELTTRAAIENEGIEKISHVIAVGKAASSMLQGVSSKLTSRAKVLLITKYGHVDESVRSIDDIEIIESGHPIPDEKSLFAGWRARKFMQTISVSDDLVMLVSGGASAVAECLIDEIDLITLKTINDRLIEGGFSIDQINSIRIRLSKIKGGKLLETFKGRQVHVYAISDVPSDDINIIGSGIGGWGAATVKSFSIPDYVLNILDRNRINKGTEINGGLAKNYKATIVSSNSIARAAVQKYAQRLNHKIQTNSFSLSDDVETVANQVSAQLIAGEKGVYIWGGEPTINLPINPGIGGRNQSLALKVAQKIEGYKGIRVLVAGTDGSDGPTDAAGGIVDGHTFSSIAGGGDALKRADAGTFLQNASALFVSGPTGTNVMDLAIGLKC